MSQTVSRSIAVQNSPIGLMVFPPEPFTPFPVPPFPLSQLYWLHHLTQLFLQNQGRCMCVSLMLDAQQQKWVRPQIPKQACNREGVCWSHYDDDYADRVPSNLIGGTYQSSGAGSLDEVTALVPAIDGMHLVNVYHNDQQLLHTFIHHSGRTHCIRPDSFLIDDVAYTLATNAQQMTLC